MARQDYRTIGAVAEQLGVPRWRLAYWIERGDVPGPSTQVAGRRLFTDDDVAAIREAIEKRRARSADATQI